MDLAQKWDLKKWVESDGRVRWYGCRGGHADNTTSCSRRTGLAVPPCDLENLADAIKFIMKECENAGVYCELNEGSVLGKSVNGFIIVHLSQGCRHGVICVRAYSYSVSHVVCSCIEVLDTVCYSTSGDELSPFGNIHWRSFFFRCC